MTATEQMARALAEIAALKTWNECATATPQIRPTKADISNDLDRAIAIARNAIAAA